MSNPTLYRQCLRSAVSLAHQMAIRWALSKYFTKNRFLSIGIAAGDYASIDNYLLPLLNARLPGDPVIRMTDYARQCLLTNDIRALLCSRPNEMTLFNGETLTIWWVVGFWSEMYFDFVPGLLRDKVLQNDPASVEALTRLIWSPEKIELQPAAGDESNAVMTFYRFPHNSLLGIEIAKTLYYRRQILGSHRDPSHLPQYRSDPFTCQDPADAAVSQPGTRCPVLSHCRKSLSTGRTRGPLYRGELRISHGGFLL